MTKRPSLAETMQKVVRQDAVPARTADAAPPARASENQGGGFYAATRAGKKKLTAALDPAAHTQFRRLALDLGKNGEALLVEAINDLFSKYGKPPIT